MAAMIFTLQGNFGQILQLKIESADVIEQLDIPEVPENFLLS